MSTVTRKTASPIIFFGIGLFIIFTTWPKVKPGYDCKNWPTTKGVILEAEVQKVLRGDEVDSYEPALKYSYEIAGVKRASSRITFNAKTMSFKSRDEANAFLSKYQVGTEIAVRYDPQHPEEAVLIAGHDSGRLTFLAVGVAFLVWGVPIWLKTRSLTKGINTEQSDHPGSSIVVGKD